MSSPLYDAYDPYGILREQAKAGLLPDGVARNATLADLMPEAEKRSRLNDLANATASGLTGLGWILDTPGAFARGTISGLMEGDPLKGVRALWQPSDERVSGRDLFRQAGLIGDEDTYLNWAGGLAGEMALDPLSYLNPLAILGRGASTAAARAASRAGMLDDLSLVARRAGVGPREYMLTRTANQLAADVGGDASLRFGHAARGKGLDPNELGSQTLGALAEFRVPGTEVGVPVSLGQNFDRWAARGLDSLGERLSTNPWTAPVVNRLTAAFDPTVMGRIQPEEQWRAREAVAGARAGERAFREREAVALLAARNANPEFDQQAIQNAIVDSIEAATPERLAGLAPESRAAIARMESVPQWAAYRDFLRDELAGRQERLAALGVQTPTASDPTGLGFFPRQQIEFASPRKAQIPGNVAKQMRPYDRGERLYNLDDVVGMSRRPYLESMSREQIRRLTSGPQAAELRDRLFGASDDSLADIVDAGARDLGVTLPYDSRPDAAGNTIESLRGFLADPALTAAERAEYEPALRELERQSRQMKQNLGQLLRSADRQLADSGRGLFDRNTSADILRYGIGGARSEANARVVTDALVNAASDLAAGEVPGGGYVNLLAAAEGLGFQPSRLREILETRMPGRDVGTLSVPQRVVEELKAIAPRSIAPERGMAGRLWDSFTNAFKVGALANPAYHARNAYSGTLSSLTAGGMNPLELGQSAYAGLQAGRGNYGPMVNRLRRAPAFQALSDQEIVDEFLIGGARNNLGQGQIMESGLANDAQNLLIGQDAQRQVPYVGDGGLLYDPNRSWRDWMTVRGVDFEGGIRNIDRPSPNRTLNPLIDLHERTGRRVEDMLRIGTYIEGLRQGMSPDAAAALVSKAQVDYTPQAFTQFERNLKRYVPFYSYTRGIAPLVVENLLYRPGGVQGQITRAVSAAARPSEDSFMPDDLKKTTAVQLPGAYGEDGNLQRYLTKIDLPWRGLVDLISPTVGNNPIEAVGNTALRTGLNLMGQLNPLIKAPLELLTDRQFYSGRELSDTYSMLEKDIGPAGRPLEQLVANLPGGSKILGLVRTARDERLSPLGRVGKLAFNYGSGFGITDRDPEKARGQAARAMLTQLLKSTPGVRTYENLTVPEEALQAMSPEQRDLYLLYKILQSDSAKAARERKKAELDPMAMLGAVR